MPKKKKKKLERETPSPDTLGVNMRQLAKRGLAGPGAEELLRQEGIAEIIKHPCAARKVGTDLTK
jgi:hypothetical protein